MTAWASRSKPSVWSLDEAAVHQAPLDHLLERAVEEADVAAHVDEEVAVGDLGAKQRALHIRRHPVAFHPRLAVGVDHRDLGASLLGVVEVLHRHRLVVGHIRADEHDQVAADPVAVRTRRGGHAQRALEPKGARRVADPGGVVDRVGPHRPHGLLRGEVGLVGGAPAGQVDAKPLGGAGADTPGDQVEGLVPARPGEARLAPAAHHRVGETAEVAQLGAVLTREEGHVGEQGRVQRRHGVQSQQPQADVAEMNLPGGPVAHALGAKGAAVAGPLGQDAPGIARLVAVLPEGVPELQVVVGMLLADAERLQAGPVARIQPLLPGHRMPLSTLHESRAVPRAWPQGRTRGCGTADLPWPTRACRSTTLPMWSPGGLGNKPTHSAASQEHSS